MKNNHAIIAQVLLMAASVTTTQVWAAEAMNPYVVMVLGLICTISLIVSIKSHGPHYAISTRGKLAEASLRPFVLFFSAIHLIVLLVAASLIH